MGEPRDFQALTGLAKRKYSNDAQAVELMKKSPLIRWNFIAGYSRSAEFLLASQRSVCFTC